ncbi:unnamed protein product [Spirodela intermedia]|uniref:Uncharacterized protein n=1 Tax=Spirodela intermedia TaxID=51605 RepID=A0A7I8LIP0_SPIIN|nr:unnamed protein product [Spirodela intermedia]
MVVQGKVETNKRKLREGYEKVGNGEWISHF